MEDRSSVTRILNVAIRQLTVKSRTEKELRQRLSRDFAELPDIDQILDEIILRLRELNFLNDSRYAENTSRLKVHKGNRFISQTLRQKGVDEGIIDEVLVGLPDEFERALEQAYKKQWSLQGMEPEKARAKLMRFLHSRSFSIKAITKVVKRLQEEAFF